LDILRRVADGRSDREIAEALFLSLNTIKWHNRQIYSKLGVSSRTQAVAVASQEGLLDVQPAPLETAAAERMRNLPAQVTSFVGREEQIGEVKRLLNLARLLTLTGPGGVGKTRLATQAAAELAEAGAFEDGIFFVDLAPVSQSEWVGDAIGKALGVMAVAGQPISKVLEKYLGNKNSLLLLDNFEHLLEAAPLVSDLLSAAPGLSVLVTSREALRLYGEQQYPVPPLRLPDLSKKTSPSALMDHESVALFVQRSRAVKPDLTLTDEDASRVAEICVRLDGLPLAIELAAAQMRLFSPMALLNRLESRITALNDGPRGLPEKQRTLRGAIDWSYELLDDAEKTLFAELSVFQGGCTIEAAEEVCCHDLPIDALEGLASLLNKSLLRQREGPDGEPRFTMLETIHEYARERLLDSVKAEDMHRGHAQYFTALAERAEPHTRGGPDQMRYLRRLEAEHGNLRAMYRWSMERGEAELGLRLVGALGYFWWRQGHYAEGQQWTEQALELIGGAPPAVGANVFSAAGRVSSYMNDAATSERLLGEALALYRKLGARRDVGWTLIHLTTPSIGRRDKYEHAMALCEEGLSLLREADDKAGIAQALTNIGELARAQQGLPRARDAYEEALKVARENGDGLREAIVLIDLGLAAQYEGDAERARALFRQGLTLAVEIGHLVLKVDALAYLAGATGALGRLKRAARLFGAAEAFYDAYGFSLQAGDLPEWKRSRASVCEQLDEATFNALCAEGKAMSLDEAITFSLEEPVSDE
jgi:predicted ATPase/DNA-binding CsgD family transcriptional regulator